MSSTPSRAVGQKVATFSDQARLEQEAREAQREHHRAEQRNESITSAARIAAWEKLHGLQMPSAPEHPVLLAIARHTKLSMAQIREVQAARAALPAPPTGKADTDFASYAP